jgi:hypothetical protein
MKAATPIEEAVTPLPQLFYEGRVFSANAACPNLRGDTL